MTGHPSLRRGTTLLELCVTIAVMAVATSVVALAARGIDCPDPADFTMRIVAARRAAVATGRPVLLTIVRHDTVLAISAYPDGTVLADSSLHLEPLTGRSRAR